MKKAATAPLKRANRLEPSEDVTRESGASSRKF